MRRPIPARPLARLLRLLPLLAGAILAAGCAAKQTARVPVFWPGPPDEPRIQYLTGISDSRDLGKNGFSLFAVGTGSDTISKIEKPFGIAVRQDKVYVADTPKAQVWVLDLAAKTLTELSGNVGQGKLSKPVNLELDAEGNLYVADTGRKEVVVYDSQGKHLKAFGPRQGLSMKPADVAVHGDRLYVADLANNEVKVLNRRDGRLLETLKGEDADAERRVAVPTALAVGTQGNLHVVNMGNGRLLKMDADGHVLSGLGGLGKNWGFFARPRGIAVDEAGRVFVVDAGHGNCQVFDADDRLLVFFGEPGLPEGSMVLPAGVATTRENLDHFRKYADPDFELEELIFVTNQYSRHAKIAVYGLGRMKGWSQPPPAAPAAETQSKPKVTDAAAPAK